MKGKTKLKLVDIEIAKIKEKMNELKDEEKEERRGRSEDKGQQSVSSRLDGYIQYHKRGSRQGGYRQGSERGREDRYYGYRYNSRRESSRERYQR